MGYTCVLLTGGSGFIASHILDALLQRQYHVTATVRSDEKGRSLMNSYPDHLKTRLSYTVVEDIVQAGAYDKAVTVAAFEYVIHTACPYHFNFVDPVMDFINPAVEGTMGLLQAAKLYAPRVKRVVLLSSSATILNPFNHSRIYDESIQGLTTWEEAMKPNMAYRASKIFAEQAALDFVSTQCVGYDLVVLNPPLVFGPVARHLKSLQGLNTSNQRIHDLITGSFRDRPNPTGPVHIFADVRDVAEAHARALEVPEAGGQRFFIVGGYFSNKRLADAIRVSHPALATTLPNEDEVDDMPQNSYGWDNSKSRRVLGLQYRGLRECVADAVDSILAVRGI